LARHFSHQTIVFISHRISALKWADRIVVLNRGVIEEQGTHDHLMTNRGQYASLYNTIAVTTDGGGFSSVSTSTS
ncbi:MAG: hypothetical protein DMG85_16725, partial [Acidobacteria bacterium]